MLIWRYLFSCVPIRIGTSLFLLWLILWRKSNYKYFVMQQLSLFRGVHDTQPRPVTLEEVVTMMRTDQSVRDLTEKHRYARTTGDE